MKFKPFLLIATILLASSIKFEVISSQYNIEYDERCLAGIQSHLSKQLLEWGEITSKIPLEYGIDKNVLKIGIYVVHDDPNKLNPDKWMFIHKENEFYISGYCEHGDPRTVEKGRMKGAMKAIDKTPVFKDVQWKTLKAKTIKEHYEDFRKRGILININKDFDSTNLGHTEQAWLSDLLDLDSVPDYTGFKAVIAMSSSNITCDKCAQSIIFSMKTDEFQFKDRALNYFADYANPVEYIPDDHIVWDSLPPVSIVFSSYDYRTFDIIEKVGHNKTYIFP